MENTELCTAGTPAEVLRTPKAMLPEIFLNACSRANFKFLHQAVIAWLIAYARLHDDYGWMAGVPQKKLAAKIHCHLSALRRALRELEDAGLISRYSGDGDRHGFYVLKPIVEGGAPGGAPPARAEARPRAPGGAPGRAPGIAPARAEARPCAPGGAPSKEVNTSLQIQSEIPSSSPGAAAVPGDDDDGRFRAKVEYLSKRPDWLKETLAWITPARAAKLATLPLTQEAVDRAIREAKGMRNTLDNPAGYVISKLEEAAR